MNDREKEYRQRAEKLRAIADSIDEEQVRLSLHVTANGYDAMADRLRDRVNTLSR